MNLDLHFDSDGITVVGPESGFDILDTDEATAVRIFAHWWRRERAWRDRHHSGARPISSLVEKSMDAVSKPLIWIKSFL